MSRWFGHTVEISTRDGRRLVVRVIGFEYAGDGEDEDVEVLVVPLDHVRHPQVNQYAIRWISSRPCSTGAPERPGSRRPSAI